MLPEFPSAALISEYLHELEYLFSRMNVGSYAPPGPHLWLVGKIPLHTWEVCRSTSERKRHSRTYNGLVDPLMELALERENASQMGKFPNRHLGKGAKPPSRSC